jgi:hypothetical protein
MPTYMRGRSPIHVPLHRVIDVLKTIDSLGHMEQFQKAAEAAGATVRIHPKTVNFIKDYMADNDLHTQNAVAEEIVGSGGGPDSPPTGCPYHQPGT